MFYLPSLSIECNADILFKEAVSNFVSHVFGHQLLQRKQFKTSALYHHCKIEPAYLITFQHRMTKIHAWQKLWAESKKNEGQIGLHDQHS